MADDLPRPTIAQCREKILRARVEFEQAIQRQWNGEPALRMSIPARPDHDSDLVISDAFTAALQAIDDLLAAAEQARQPWQPIASCPRNVTRALVRWPAFKLNDDLEQSTTPSPEHDLVAESYRTGASEWECQMVTEHFEFEDEAGFGYGDPTHWQPLPSPPAAPTAGETA